MAITYNELKKNGKVYWWRVYGHRGGRTYEVREPAEVGKGWATIRKNISWWVVDEKKLLHEMVNCLEKSLCQN